MPAIFSRRSHRAVSGGAMTAAKSVFVFVWTPLFLLLLIALGSRLTLWASGVSSAKQVGVMTRQDAILWTGRVGAALFGKEGKVSEIRSYVMTSVKGGATCPHTAWEGRYDAPTGSYYFRFDAETGDISDILRLETGNPTTETSTEKTGVEKNVPAMTAAVAETFARRYLATLFKTMHPNAAPANVTIDFVRFDKRPFSLWEISCFSRQGGQTRHYRFWLDERDGSLENVMLLSNK